MIPGGSAATGCPAGSRTAGRPGSARDVPVPPARRHPGRGHPARPGPRLLMRPPGTGSAPRPGRPAGSPRSAPRGSWTPGSTRTSPTWSASSSKGRPWPRPSRPRGRWTGPVLAALAIGAATGLTSIHQAGLVHGDFGPDHVVLGTEGPAGGPLQHHAAVRHRDPVRGPARLGPDDPVRRRGARTCASLPEPLRNTVSACMSADPASRPPARTLVTALLGQGDPAAGLLAEGTRRARAAGRGPVSPDSDGPGRDPPPCPGPAGSPGPRPAWPASRSSWWRPS